MNTITMDMRTDLEALVARYGSGINLAKELKKLHDGDKSKRAKLEAAMDKVIADYGTITLARFKKEAAAAWRRAFPDGVEKRELKGYQLFVKETMPKVKADNPNATHIERMAIIGKMWQDSKGVPPAKTEQEPDSEPITTTEEDTTPIPPPPQNKRGRRIVASIESNVPKRPRTREG